MPTQDSAQPSNDEVKQPLIDEFPQNSTSQSQRKTVSPKINSVSAADINKPKAKPKPLIEGINAPKASGEIVYVKTDTPAQNPSPLTPDEKKLVSETEEFMQEPRLIPQSTAKAINHKNNRSLSWLIVALFIAALIYAGYEVYGWYITKPRTQNSNLNYQLPQTVTNQTGGLSATAVLPTTSSSTSTAMIASGTPVIIASSTPPTTTPVNILQLTVSQTPTGYLNVRSGPSTSYGIITQVHPGETYPYTSVQSGWYKITLPNQTSGWVSGQYVKAQ